MKLSYLSYAGTIAGSEHVEEFCRNFRRYLHGYYGFAPTTRQDAKVRPRSRSSMRACLSLSPLMLPGGDMVIES